MLSSLSANETKRISAEAVFMNSIVWFFRFSQVSSLLGSEAPFTTQATHFPKPRSMSFRVMEVSSNVSCGLPAITTLPGQPRSMRILATPKG